MPGASDNSRLNKRLNLTGKSLYPPKSPLEPKVEKRVIRRFFKVENGNSEKIVVLNIPTSVKSSDNSVF